MVINALKLRQAFGEVLKKLQKNAEPIIVEKGRKPVAVLITIEMYNERFVDFKSALQQAEILSQFNKNAVETRENSLKVIRELRYG